MNASITSRVTVATVGLLGTIGLLAGSASAEPNETPNNQGTVVVGTAGNTRYVATDGEVTWGDDGTTSATRAISRFSDLTVIDTDLGPVYVGTAGTIRYAITNNEVIWGSTQGGTAA
jgi:hypothetical protein